MHKSVILCLSDAATGTRHGAIRSCALTLVCAWIRTRIVFPVRYDTRYNFAAAEDLQTTEGSVVSLAPEFDLHPLVNLQGSIYAGTSATLQP